MRRLLLLALLASAISVCAAAPAQASFIGPCLPGATGAPWCTVLGGKVTRVDDGDTVDVHLNGAPGGRVRITGIQAMEETVYSADPKKRQGECHANEATAYMESVLKMSRWRVRMLGQSMLSQSRHRALRAAQVRIRGKWKDLGSLIVARGHALWMPARSENAWNGLYSWLMQRAAARGVGLFDTDYCGVGPDQDIPIKVDVRPNPRGDDSKHLNGEWIRVSNLGTRPLSLSGWWVRDSALRRYTFAPGVVVAPGAPITVHVGTGIDTLDELYWGLRSPVFENATSDRRALGDGGYLFDPEGDLRAWDMYPCRYACSTTP